jgi:hypothetical protein
MSLAIDTGIAPNTYGNQGANEIAQATQTVKSSDAPVSQPIVQSQAAEGFKAQEPVKQPGGTIAKHRDAVTITYDTTAGVTVFKSFDSKGNLVTQVPPTQLLKTMELEGKSKEEIKGQVINTKA